MALLIIYLSRLPNSDVRYPAPTNAQPWASQQLDRASGTKDIDLGLTRKGLAAAYNSADQNHIGSQICERVGKSTEEDR